MNSLRIFSLVLILVVAFLSGCATYVTPGGSVPLAELRSDASGAASATQKQTVLPVLPATVAIVRIQAPQFHPVSPDESRSCTGFSVVSVGDFFSPSVLERLSAWPAVAGIALIDPAALPENFGSRDDLRLAAAKMGADVMLVYTVDTSFRVRGRLYEPGSTVPIGGKKPGSDTAIAVTVSGLFTDVRTGSPLGHAAATALASDPGSVWSSAEAIDRKRLEAEHQALELMLADAEHTWLEITRRD